MAPYSLLLVAFEEDRWGPARLARPLSLAGFRVTALCPRGNVLARSRFLHDHYLLESVSSAASVARSLSRAMRETATDLVILGDERVVACLQAIARSGKRFERFGVDRGLREVIARSLGDPDRYPQMLFKTECRKLATSLGVRTPPGFTVLSDEEPAERADELGYPVYVKASLGSGGAGVVACPDRDAMLAAIGSMKTRRPSWLRNLLRRRLWRDWYPSDAAVEVQKAITGQVATYCASALDGRLLAGFGGLVTQTRSATGPSTRIELGRFPEMDAAATQLIKAFGASGFLGFDFIVEAATGDTYLLECNARVPPTAHLGPHVGADLCSALADAWRHGPGSPRLAAGSKNVMLFPQEWMRAPEGMESAGAFVDAPWSDPELLVAMTARGLADAAAASGRQGAPPVE